ncbi:gliding motility-associated C-terminal domain-containing protein [Siansivirga zeaxanthinifaciens]|uniref:Gliding motility-associated C-terminal domain-containing protein n=1 Tax=Siansivirga zeaxanthinifaciens CC-SAMT-1 TaxID=1454006 RepID=A0A0C5WF57_9FLAO|nr:T9SS C-terminal target domain-containing protein [Siansivirga zeaxanthinifaciens]AJR04847.1 hypothetical protein AW14_06905 [Siansivirga zeaxanthinifaciens CC-SAMT-1]
MPHNIGMGTIIDDGLANPNPSPEPEPDPDPSPSPPDECLFINNEFSPNGDSANDFFVIDCIENYPDNVLEIYNRWGNIVYKAKGYKNNWDGTSNGRATLNGSDKLPVGTYYYLLDLGDGTKPKAGWLYLNR